MKAFAAADRNKDGVVTFEEWCAALNVPADEFAHEVFDMIDVSETGQVTQRRFS
tara:strand:- start:420 stop:581 length:162 start_codon:yes stop_codon:yes gene_type:complete